MTRDAATNMPTASVEMSLDKRQFHSIPIEDITIADMNEVFIQTNNHHNVVTLSRPTTQGSNNNNSTNNKSNNNANNIRMQQQLNSKQR